MPRVRRTVGFWRGPSQTKKPALMPAPDRWTGTSVDGWPSNILFALRRELLAVKRENPDIGDERLVAHATAWLHTNHPHAGTKGKKKGGKASGAPRSVGVAHVRALLAPPRPRRPKVAKPAEVDRSPRPTTLSGEELARVIRRNQAAASKRTTATPPSAQAVDGAAVKPKPKKARKHAAIAAKQRKPRKPLPRAAIRAGVSPRGSFVMWPADVNQALRVHLSIYDLRRVGIRTVKTDVAARYAVFDAPAAGFEVTARFLNKNGTTVAEGRAEHRALPE